MSDHDPAIQDYLRDAGFLVKSSDKITPDWSKNVEKEALEKLSLPQLDSLVRIAHTDLSERISNDVKQGMSIEEAYMFRASTDLAAILIAQASLIKNDKLHNALNELKQSCINFKTFNCCHQQPFWNYRRKLCLVQFKK